MTTEMASHSPEPPLPPELGDVREQITSFLQSPFHSPRGSDRPAWIWWHPGKGDLGGRNPSPEGSRSLHPPCGAGSQPEPDPVMRLWFRTSASFLVPVQPHREVRSTRKMQEGEQRPAARLYATQHKQDPDSSHEICCNCWKKRKGDVCEGTHIPFEGETGRIVRLSTMKLKIILYEADAFLSGFLLSIWGTCDTSSCLT